MSENGRATTQIIYNELRDFRLEVRHELGDIKQRVDRLESYRDQNHWPRTIVAWTLRALVPVLVSGATAYLVAIR